MNVKRVLIVMNGLLLFSCSGIKKSSLTDYSAPPQKTYKGWDEAFDNAREVEVKTLVTGYIEGDRTKNLNKKNGNISKITSKDRPVAIKAFLIRHPEKGDILIDTGLDSSFCHDPYGNLSFLSRIYMKQSGFKIKIRKGQDLNSQLLAFGVHPQKLFFTHIHHDHTAGLPALDDDIEVILDRNELKGLPQMLVSGHFKGKHNIKCLDFANSVSISPFDKVIDIFGDSSLFAISTPGHTKGHISYLVNAKNNPVLIVGDAIFYQEAYMYDVEAATIDGKEGREAAKQSHAQIKTFLMNHPDVHIIYTHDD